MGGYADFAGGGLHRFPGLVKELFVMGWGKGHSSYFPAPSPRTADLLDLGHVGK